MLFVEKGILYRMPFFNIPIYEESYIQEEQ